MAIDDALRVDVGFRVMAERDATPSIEFKGGLSAQVTGDADFGQYDCSVSISIRGVRSDDLDGAVFRRMNSARRWATR